MAKPLINISAKAAILFPVFLVLYEFLTYMANDMIMPGMIKVVQTFKGKEADIASSLTCYMLGGASLQLFLGPISDRYGRRPVMLFGALLFFLCTLFIACSNSMQQFLCARFFQGMGLCFIAVIGYATVQEIFAEMDAIRLISIMGNVSILAPLMGPLLGATLVSYHSWRYVFVFISFFSIVALWGLWSYMPESIGQKKTDGTIIKPSHLSLKKITLNYKKLILTPPVIFGGIALGLACMPCIVWIALSPVILVMDAKLSMVQYGLWQIPVFGASIIGNVYLHKLSHKFSLKKILMRGSLISIFGLFLSLILSYGISSYFIWFMPGLIIYFFGLCLVAATLNRYVLFSTEVGKGTTSAVVSIVSMLIQALSIELANGIYVSHNNSQLMLFCFLGGGLVYFIFLSGALYLNPLNKLEPQEKQMI
ncbi:MAG: MFS transporter [Proteobacteria bacterium]|nr:MFS transporter [Pseudomonadota bacterium]